MKKSISLMILLSSLPMFAFATTGGDTTFGDLTTKITGFLTGSLGMTFVLIGFVGAAAAIAGFASMKVMFPVFGLCLALHYGPDILTKVFSADGSIPTGLLTQSSLSIFDLILLLASSALLVIGIYHYKQQSQHSKQSSLIK